MAILGVFATLQRWTLLTAVLMIAPAAHGQVVIELGTATGFAGERVVLEVRLRSNGSEVVGIENVLQFDPVTPVAIHAGQSSIPDCFRLDHIPLGGYGFRFDTDACITPGCPIRALVLEQDQIEPIPDGTRLYGCAVEIAVRAPAGSYAVRCSSPGAVDKDGNRLAAECIDGTIEVTATPTPTDIATPTMTPLPPTNTPSSTLVRAESGGGCQVAPTEDAPSLWPIGLALFSLVAWRRILRAAFAIPMPNKPLQPTRAASLLRKPETPRSGPRG
jgi:hypothetical protein